MMDSPGPASVPVKQVAATGASLDWRLVWQLCSMTLGIGVFTLPDVFVHLGLVQATISVLVMGMFANLAMQRLLDVTADHSTVISYEAVAQHAFGKAGKIVMVLSTVVTCSIASMSYLKTAANLFEEPITSLFSNFAHPIDMTAFNKKSLLTAMVAVVLPACLSPTMGKNAWISKLGIFNVCLASIFFVGRCTLIISNGCSHVPCGNRPTLFSDSLLDSIEFTATLAMAFSTVFAVHPILQECMTNGSAVSPVETVKCNVKFSVVICCALFLIIGLVGALTFGTQTKTIALTNIPSSEPLAQVITLLLGISVWLLVAIVSFPSIQCLASLCPSHGNGKERLCVVIMFGVMLVVLDTVLPTRVCFTLCGVGLSMASYIMPCAISLYLGGRLRGCYRALEVVVLLFGLAVLLVATPVTLARLPSTAS